MAPFWEGDTKTHTHSQLFMGRKAAVLPMGNLKCSSTLWDVAVCRIPEGPEMQHERERNREVGPRWYGGRSKEKKEERGVRIDWATWKWEWPFHQAREKPESPILSGTNREGAIDSRAIFVKPPGRGYFWDSCGSPGLSERSCCCCWRRQMGWWG